MTPTQSEDRGGFHTVSTFSHAHTHTSLQCAAVCIQSLISVESEHEIRMIGILPVIYKGQVALSMVLLLIQYSWMSCNDA